MKFAKRISPLVAVLLSWSLAPGVSHAYVDIELEGNRHVIGDSYVDQGGKLVVYRPSGAVEVDRASVRSIHERSGDMPSAVQRFAVPDAAAPASASAPSTGAPSAGVHSKDPQARDRELATKLIDIRLNRLAAMQRGDDAAMKKLDKEINTLQGERTGNWKKLHPGADGDTSSD
jgi:hypothetical protein